METACVIYNVNLPSNNTEILTYVLNYIQSHKLFTDNNLYIINTGALLNINGNYYQNYTTTDIYNFSTANPNCKILFLNIKGLFYNNYHWFNFDVKDWVNFILYTFIDNSRQCLEILDYTNIVTCEYRPLTDDHMLFTNSIYGLWTKSSYIVSIPITHSSDIKSWLLTDTATIIINKFQNIDDILNNVKNIDTLPILYGIDDNYRNVTSICHKHLIKNNILRIPSEDHIRNSLFIDFHLGIHKYVKIGNVKYDIGDNICYQMSNNISTSLDKDNCQSTLTPNLCIVTYTDIMYLNKALKTINDIRTRGCYSGDLVLITDGNFKLPNTVIESMNIIIKEYPDIDTRELIAKIKQHPFTNSDQREYNKTKQWNKFYVFDTYFKNWDYIMFVDAGLRIFDCIEYFYPQLYKNAIVALDDGHPHFDKKFNCQIELSNTEIVDKLKLIYDIDSSYFLNCLFIFDSQLINDDTIINLVNLMNAYPICKTNEMAVMNIYFHKYWIPLNIYLDNGKILFDWAERDGKYWHQYVSLKYPISYKD